MNAIEIKGLIKNVKSKQILKNINLCLPEGKIIGILGPNGSGKTTTFKCILNLMHFEGNIKLSGIDNQVNPSEAIKKIGAIIEEPAFYSNLSGYKNMIIASKYYNNIENSRITA